MRAIESLHAVEAKVRCLLCLLMAVTSSACLVRRPLLAPVPVTQGATVVPSKGLNFAISGGTGLLAQERNNSGVSMGRVGAGIANRVGVSFGSYGGTEDNVTGGTFGQLKVQGTPLFGGRGLWGIHLATAQASVTSSVQDESLSMVDVALPVEILLVSEDKSRISAYLGPRFVRQSFTDRRDPAGSHDSSYTGLLAGLHAKLSFIRILAEVTIAPLPEGTYLGQPVGGRTAVLPMVEIGFTIGPDQVWPGLGNR